MAAPEIRWAERQHVRYGTVTGIRLFTITYSIDRADSAAGTPWVLRTDLPGVKEQKAASDQAARAQAARTLAGWLERITGTAP